MQFVRLLDLTVHTTVVANVWAFKLLVQWAVGNHLGLKKVHFG